jgi:hypothetical protein
MKAHWEIVQKSTEWYEIKNGRIGGSTAKSLFTSKDSPALINQLVAERTEEFDIMSINMFENDAMMRGNELEPLVRKELIDVCGVELLECGWIQSDLDILGISPDAVSSDLNVAMESKCPTGKFHIEYCLSSDIPLLHVPQCIHYFTVIEALEKLYFISFRPESIKRRHVIELTRESVVNIGTKTKPILLTIQQATEQAKLTALDFQKQIDLIIEKLSF